MACFVDPLFRTTETKRWPFKQASHLACDSTKELITITDKIGLLRQWIQDQEGPTEHFDLTANMRAMAIRAGAKEITHRDMAAMFERKRKALTNDTQGRG